MPRCACAVVAAIALICVARLLIAGIVSARPPHASAEISPVQIAGFHAASSSSLTRLPLQNPAGEFRLELGFEAQGSGGDGGEGDVVESVALDAALGHATAIARRVTPSASRAPRSKPSTLR